MILEEGINIFKKRHFFLVVLITFLLGEVNSETIDYKDGLSIEETNVEKKKLYEVQFKSNIPDYIHITVEPKDESTDSEFLGNNQILSFSSTDSECMNGREQLAQSFKGNVEMWVKKEQFQNAKFYLMVQCQSSNNCNYKISFESKEFVVLNRNRELNYYISKNNMQMKFYIPKRDLDTEIIHNNIATIWAKGNKGVLTTLSYVLDKTKTTILNPKEFLNGVIYTFNENGYIYPDDPQIEAYYELIVNANEGDLLTVGNKAINENDNIADKNILFPNTEETTGYLKKNVLNKECYYLNRISSAEETDYIFISGYFYSINFDIAYYNTDGFLKEREAITKVNYAKKLSYKEIDGKNIMCVEFSDVSSSTEIVYNFQIVDTKNRANMRNIYSPQLTGIRYNRIIPSDTIVTFSGTDVDFNNYIHYNLRIIDGIIRMFFHQCENFPLCDYTDEQLIEEKNGIIGPHYSNKMYSHLFNDHKYKESPISPNQNLIIVKCFSKTSNEETFCNFETSIYTDKYQIKMEPSIPYYRYIVSGETDKYLINLDDYSNLSKVFIDLLIIAGDVFIDVQASQPYSYNKYEVSNKIFYSIHTNKASSYSDLGFYIKASNNSYYLVTSYLIHNSSEELINYLDSGVNILEAIDEKSGGKTTVSLINNGKNYNFPFLVQFYSLNCQFDIARQTGEKLNVIDSFAQELIKPEDKLYLEDYYNYQLTIKSIDSSRTYEGDFCFFYASGLEIDGISSSEKTNISRQILIGENIPQRVIFEDGIKNIKYLFPHSSPDKSLNINFNLIDLAHYEVNIYFEYLNSNTLYTISRSQHIYLSTDEPKWEKACGLKNKLCNIIIDVTLVGTVFDETPMLEISAKPIPSFPTYVTKSLMRTDYLSGDQWLFLYTDLSYQDEGDVVFNFKDGSGQFYGKIVPKTITSPESGAEWRGLFKFPRTAKESISSNSYLKKLLFTSSDTQQCQKGCYLLMSIKTNMDSDINEEYRPIYFSMIVHSYYEKATLKDIPIIQVPTDEYIIGNVDENQENIKDFYSVILTNDGEELTIDWQSDAGCIYINIGEERPSIYDTDYVHCSPGYDSVFSKTKNEILKKYGDTSRTTLKDLKITIGPYTTRLDSVFTSVFSMKISLRKPAVNIYPMNSNQKVLCPTEKTPYDQNLCLFVVLYQDLNALQNLVVYPKSQNNIAKVIAHADYISYDKYERWDTDYLTSHIPNENSTYSNSQTSWDFLYVPNGEFESHLYIAVYSDIETTIELITSFSGFDNKLTPNPSTSHVFSIKKEFFTLRFIPDNDYAISLVTLSGKSQMHWETEPSTEYYIGGREDRLSIALTSDMCINNECNLIIKNLEPSNIDNEEIDKQGFTFYISYSLRASGLPGLIFEELLIGKSTKIAYRNSKFPLILYCQLPDKESSVNLFFDLYETKSDSEKKTVYDSSIDINAMLVSSNDIFLFKKDPTLIKIDPNTVKGIFNSALTVGHVYLSKDDLKKFISVNEDPWLFLYITKTSDIPDQFSKITFVATAAKATGEVYTSEKVYQFAKLGVDEKNVYKLKGNSERKFMRIQISTNSEVLGWSVRKMSTDTDDYKKNDTSIEIVKSEWSNGRGSLTMKLEKGEDIYLTIFKLESKDIDIRLTNYVFKYMLASDIADFKEYKIENDTISYNKKDNQITFNKIKDAYSANSVKYYVKLVKKDSLINGEKINTIAVTQSTGQSYEYENNLSNEETITLELKDLMVNTIYYCNIIVEISEGAFEEYISYSSSGTILVGINNDSEGSSNSNSTIVIILVGILIIFALFIGVLLFCLFKIRKVKNNLLDKVNVTSFKSQKEVDLIS